MQKYCYHRNARIHARSKRRFLLIQSHTKQSKEGKLATSLHLGWSPFSAIGPVSSAFWTGVSGSSFTPVRPRRETSGSDHLGIFQDQK